MTPPRVRFAPSPTGYLHVGSVRTALYNWLFARHEGGTLLLRIEDTDEARNREEWVEGICSSLRWVGLDWDEGPFRQSERRHLYAKAAEDLEAAGRAYWCDCTREAIDARAKERGGPPGYDGFCRDRGLGRGEGRALRFRVPDEGTTVVPDLIRGEPSFPNAAIEDFVLVRTNGTPVFLLANAVDDVDMGITHVIRGEDLLPSTPKYLLLRHALGTTDVPVFAHLPLIVNEKRQKLSKRRDPVALELYRDEGYLPEVMLNFLALMGWGPPSGREQLPVEDMVAEFRLEDVGSSSAFFDTAKLRAFNGDAIRALPVEEFLRRAAPWLAEAADDEAVRRLAPLVQERVVTLAEAPELVAFLRVPDDGVPMDEGSWGKAMKEPAGAALERAEVRLGELDGWTADGVRAALDAVAEDVAVGKKKVHAAVRVAVTGRTVGLPLFESVEVLGRERTLARLGAARSRMG
ncbi:MAG: glutamyl-tRNA synthetase [Acidimicrobiales bacterium]|nr:glutamyl-tRNA synthetase [Acidimicrobiales bacterium]